MSFVAMVSVRAIDFHGVWDYEVGLPHGVRATKGSLWLSAWWREFRDFFSFRGFRVLLRG